MYNLIIIINSIRSTYLVSKNNFNLDLKNFLVFQKYMYVGCQRIFLDAEINSRDDHYLSISFV